MRKRKTSITEANCPNLMSTLLQYTPSFANTTDDISVGRNIIIQTDTTNQSTYSEPTFLSNPVTKLQDTQHLTEDIISKLSQMDGHALAKLQQFMTQGCSDSSVNSLIRQPEYSDSTQIFSPFVPVGMITDFTNHNSEIEQENKPEIPKNFSLEQVYQLPGTMFGYIFDENNDNLVKVQLFQNSEGLQTYIPYKEYQETQLATCNTISHHSADIKLETQKTKTHSTCTQSKRPDLQVKNDRKKTPTFRKVTAKWKHVRNRSLHSKFVKTFKHRVIRSPTKQTSAPKQNFLPKNNTHRLKKASNKPKGKYT